MSREQLGELEARRARADHREDRADAAAREVARREAELLEPLERAEEDVARARGAAEHEREALVRELGVERDLAREARLEDPPARLARSASPPSAGAPRAAPRRSARARSAARARAAGAGAGAASRSARPARRARRRATRAARAAAHGAAARARARAGSAARPRAGARARSRRAGTAGTRRGRSARPHRQHTTSRGGRSWNFTKKGRLLPSSFVKFQDRPPREVRVYCGPCRSAAGRLRGGSALRSSR